MSLTRLSVSEFLAAIRSSDPTPGGGSAAALAGAMGASLLAMVAALPKPKATSDEDLKALASAGERASDMARRLEALVDEDTNAYNTVVAAFRLPKGSDEEKAARAAAVQEAMMAATDAPLEVMRRCVDALSHADTIQSLGNPNAWSDGQVGVALLNAGLEGAGENVTTNLGSVKDADYVERVKSEYTDLIARMRN